MRAIQNRYLRTPELFSSSYPDEEARRIEQNGCKIASAVGDSEGRSQRVRALIIGEVLLVIPMRRGSSDRTKLELYMCESQPNIDQRCVLSRSASCSAAISAPERKRAKGEYCTHVYLTSLRSFINLLVQCHHN